MWEEHSLSLSPQTMDLDLLKRQQIRISVVNWIILKPRGQSSPTDVSLSLRSAEVLGVFDSTSLKPSTALGLLLRRFWGHMYSSSSMRTLR